MTIAYIPRTLSSLGRKCQGFCGRCGFQERQVYEALRNGAYYPWDFQPLQKASERYMRNHMDLNTLEENQRFTRGE